ncbi:MAG: hypothetical protein ACT4OE_10660 [Sphingosinicella sp.]
MGDLGKQADQVGSGKQQTEQDTGKEQGDVGRNQGQQGDKPAFEQFDKGSEAKGGTQESLDKGEGKAQFDEGKETFDTGKEPAGEKPQYGDQPTGKDELTGEGLEKGGQGGK